MNVTPELEAMARAIWDSGRDPLDDPSWEELGKFTRDELIEAARAALLAIREPSDPAMIAAYLGEPPANPDAIRWTRRSFSAVIDHILGNPLRPESGEGE